jgi:4-amino-4-deoxy-L-arabinose transferase-like glycosyltransferase
MSNPTHSPSSSAKFLLVVACALLLLQALPWFSGRWVEDESWYSNRGWTLLTEGRVRNSTFADTDPQFTVDASPPAMPVVLAASFKTFGVGVWQARLPSLIAALGLVIVVYLLGSEIGGPWTGGWAAVFVACDNFLFLAARCTRPEAFVTFFSTLALLLYFWARRRESNWLSLLSGIALGCSMNFHPNGLPAGLSLAVLMLLEFKGTFWRQPRLWAAVLGVVICALPTVYVAMTNPEYASTMTGTYGGAAGRSMASKVAGEMQRYAEFFGLVRAGKGIPYRVPMRAHLVLLLVAAFVIVYRRNRQLFWNLVILLVPLVPWWAFMVNKSPRYLVVAAPFLALAAAAAVTHVGRPRSRWLAAAVVVFVGSQMAGNALLLTRFRSADYGAVTQRLRATIPPGASAFGNIVFWLALYDHPYTSYVRSSFEYTSQIRKPDYWILNDRVLVNGDGTDDADTWLDLRTKSAAFMAQQGTLVERIESPFYGDLELFRVRYGQPPAASPAR